MEAQVLKCLFKPFRHKSLHLPNRLTMSPMTRYFAPEGVPKAEVADYYGRRSRGGAGLIITEGTFPDRDLARNNERIPWFRGQRLRAWRRIVDAVHAGGGAIALQLWHVGGVRDFNFPDSPLGKYLESPSGLYAPGKRGGNPMSQEDIADVVASFARAARDAKALGFDAIELHGGHGYLFDQFFWKATNTRTDRYGGTTIKERVLFATEVIRAVRDGVGEEFPLFFRLSQFKMAAYDARVVDSPYELEEWVGPLKDAGVDIFDCSQRRFWEPEFRGSDLNLAGWVKKLTGQPTLTVGSVGLDNDLIRALYTKTAGTNIRSIVEAARRVERGDFDLVAVGRGMIADPEWARKVREGAFDELVPYDANMLKTLT